jgi:hypothetical protein
LQRPPDRRAELQRINRDKVREFIGERVLNLRLDPLALLQSLGDDNRLAEKVIGQLNVERQIETDGTLPDIGAPVVHVLIALEKLVQPGCGFLGRVDRSVLGQLQVDDQLGPVG